MSSGRIPAVEGGIQPTIFDAKADILTATAADTPARLAVGANDTVLTADSSTATGLKWAAVSASAPNWSLLNAGGTNLTGAATITVSGISAVDKIFVIVDYASIVNGGGNIYFRLNGDTTSANYANFGFKVDARSTYSAADMIGLQSSFSPGGLQFARGGGTAAANFTGTMLLSGCNSAGLKIATVSGAVDYVSPGPAHAYVSGGLYTGTSTISSVSVYSDNGNFDAGKVYVYTSAV
jgi:hypothetical protein